MTIQTENNGYQQHDLFWNAALTHYEFYLNKIIRDPYSKLWGTV